MEKKSTLLLVIIILGLSAFFINKTFIAEVSKIEVIEEVVNKDYDYYLKKIKNDNEWMKKVEENALKLNITIDSSLSKDAFDWAEKQNKKSIKSTTKDYDYYLKKIKNDKEWWLILEKEAKNNNKSIDSILSETARHWANKNKL